jgi:hypothetical protein
MHKVLSFDQVANIHQNRDKRRTPCKPYRSAVRLLSMHIRCPVIMPVEGICCLTRLGETRRDLKTGVRKIRPENYWVVIHGRSFRWGGIVSHEVASYGTWEAGSLVG